MPKEQSRRLLARNVWGKYFCLFGLRNGQELTCYSENCNRQISLAASHSLSVTSVTLLLFLCSFPSLSILLMLFAFQHCQQLWAISLAFNIVNKFQHWQHLFTFNIHNVNLLYFSQCPMFNFLICFSVFSYYYSYYEYYFLILTSILLWSFRKVYSFPALMTRLHMGGCQSISETVLNSLGHSFYHPGVKIVSTLCQNGQQCNVYSFNFEISRQGLTACATLSSLLPNQTESSSLVSILLTATIARSTSLKVAA